MLSNLGGALGAAGRHAEAVRCFDRAIALQPDLAQAYQGRAHALLHSGKLEAAVASFAHARDLAPQNDQPLLGLGMAFELLRRPYEARHCLHQAIELNPRNADAHHQLGLVQLSLGQHTEALASIERAIALQPHAPAFHTNQGQLLLTLNRPREALASFDRSISIQPDESTPHHNRGLALVSLQQYAEAIASFDRALALTPALAPSHLWRGKAFLRLGRPAEALASFEQVVALTPQDFDAHFQRGVALALLERREESVASFDKAVAINGNSAEAINNRGAVLMRLFQPERALDDFQRAVALRPDYADAHTNAGNAQKGLARYQEALGSLDRALSLKAGDLTATWSKAVLLLALGRFREGWPLYESRLRLEPAVRLQRNFGKPRWSGHESLQGKTILVHCEQGLGDTLQFCRYVPLLNALGATVLLEVQPVLQQLLGSLAFRGKLIPRGEPLPDFDLHLPLLSLPLVLNTELSTVPGNVPYLSVEPAALHLWAERLAAVPGFKVGLNWHGNPEAEKLSALQARSFPLGAAAALAKLEGVSLVSLQKGSGADQRAHVDFGEQVLQLTDPMHLGAAEIAAETAAIAMGLDLVITADTALAHLAGALGARVWVVLQHVSDWRWLIERADSPWYPTMRLFRQRKAGDWQEVFDRVAAELAAIRDEPGLFRE
jgi:tetratricopeptide (TPR) repeat protein